MLEENYSNVKKGQRALCIKSVIMNFSKEEAFTEGMIYQSNADGYLTNNQGNEEHGVYSYKDQTEDFFKMHFKLIEQGDTQTSVISMGIKQSSGKLNYELDFDFITQMAERMDANKGKYEPYNWQKPIDTRGLHKALARHFFKVMKGEYEDEGREFGHLEALALNSMMINYQLREYSEDNEMKKIETQTSQNMELISKFADYYKAETGKSVPEEIILSFFNA